MSAVATAHISALNIYPVKSCAGIALRQAQLCATGLEHDRRWMVIKPDGYFVTQRESPRLALIKPALHDQGLILNAPGMPTIQVAGVDHSQAKEVAIWRDCCPAFDEGDVVAEWLSEFLQQPVRMTRFDDAHQRISNRDWTGELTAANRFSDGYPLLVISAASLTDLNSRLEKPLMMNRFRPNIVIDGVGSYIEDTVDEMCGDGFRLKLIKPCTRCKITTTNQDTGVVEGDEPLLTLVRYRRSLELKGVLFGQNAIIVAGAGSMISVGQTVSLSMRA